MKKTSYLLLVIFVLHFCVDVKAEKITLATASNFLSTLKLLVADFNKTGEHEFVIVTGSTGKIYSQIRHGAPYDMFFSADELRADLLVDDGLVEQVFNKTYALGVLVLLINSPESDNCRYELANSDFSHMAIANPKLAPYGLAAKQSLNKLGLWQEYKSKMVMGENVAQGFQFFVTENANAAFAAYSQLISYTITQDHCSWVVPAEFHQPIRQNLVLLKSANNRQVAMDFWHYVFSQQAADILLANGYRLPEN
ncbi:MAG: molybdate ABC transporter substrate-binding protein [Proteobacteria bacterium]|nr:molybdate ABC transporter substrate-binding protein [Pseudomonadota bacterium]